MSMDLTLRLMASGKTGAPVDPTARILDFTGHGMRTLPQALIDLGFVYNRITVKNVLQYAAYAENRFAWSEDFTQSAWTRTRITVTADDAIAPDGTLTADKITESVDASSTSHVLQRSIATIGVRQTASIYAHPLIRPRIAITLGTSNVFFDITTGQITGSGGGASESYIEPAGNGWFRCFVTATPTSTVCRFSPAQTNSTNYQGDGSDACYMWGAQLNDGGRVPYIKSGATAEPGRYVDAPTLSMVQLPVNEFGNTYDINGGKYAFQDELAATNLCKQNINLLDAIWISQGLQIDPGYQAPGSPIVSFPITPTNTSAYLLQYIDTLAQKYTYSNYVKGSSNDRYIYCGLYTNIDIGVIIDTHTGAITTQVGSPITPISIPMGDYTYRVGFTFDALAGQTAFTIPRPCISDVSITAALGETCYVGGCQLEAGSYMSSVMMTDANTFTRAADRLEAPIAGISGFDPSQYSMASEYRLSTLDINALRVLMYLDNGTAANRACTDVEPLSGNFGLRVFSNSVLTTNANSGPGNLARRKVAASFAANSYLRSSNGVALASVLTGPMPLAITHWRVGSDSSGATQPNAYIYKHILYVVAKTQDELNAITA